MSISEGWKKLKQRIREIFFIGPIEVEDFDLNNENEEDKEEVSSKKVKLIPGKDYVEKRVIEDKTYSYEMGIRTPYKVKTKIPLPEGYKSGNGLGHEDRENK